MRKALSITIVFLMLFTYVPLKASANSENPFMEFDFLWDLAASGEERLPPEDSLNADATYIIRFQQTASLNDIYNCVNTSNYALLAKSEMRLFAVEISELAVFQKEYSEIIDYIEKDNVRKVDSITNDTLYNSQWAIQALHLDEAWDITTGSDIKVAVIDTGIIRSHEDFAGVNIADGYDFVTNTAYVNSDTVGHGTLVSSVICAKRNNNLGISGVTDLITLVPYRLSDTEDISISKSTRAIIMAADAGCKVINASYGGTDCTSSENMAVQYAVEKGCIVVASAGNERSSLKSYPACYKNVISVGATDSSSVLAWFSNINGVDCVAPGVSVCVADVENNSSYSSVSGTSFSTPYVTGIAALALSVSKDLTPSAFENLIHTTSTDIGSSGYDTSTGWGIVNAKLLLEQATKTTDMDSGLTFENGYVYGLTDKTTIETLKTFYGENISAEALGTGKTLTIDGKSYTIIIKGDINGNGTVDSIDYFMVKCAYINNYTLSEIQLKAACLGTTELPTAMDYLKIKRHFLGTFDIFWKA